MELQTLIDAFSKFGAGGIAIVLIILISVFAARKSGIVATGDHARLANIILSAILFGLGNDPSAESALMSVIASILAGLAFEAIKYLSSHTPNPKG